MVSWAGFKAGAKAVGSAAWSKTKSGAKAVSSAAWSKTKSGAGKAWGAAKTEAVDMAHSNWTKAKDLGLPHVKEHAVKPTFQQPWKDFKDSHNENKANLSDLTAKIQALRHAKGMDELDRKKQLTSLLWQRAKGFGKFLTHNAVTRGLSIPFYYGGKGIINLFKGGADEDERRTNSSIFWFFVFACIYHAVVIGSRLSIKNRIFLNLFWMILVPILFIFHPSERNGKTYRIMLVCFCIEVIVPWMVASSSMIASIDFIRLFVANGFIMLTWIYYAVYRGSEAKLWYIRLSRFLIIMWWVFIILSYGMGQMYGFTDLELDTADYERWDAFLVLKDKFVEGGSQIFTSTWGAFSRFGDIWEIRKKQLTSTYYVGQVEENEEEQLGVYIEDVMASKEKFYEDERVTVFAILMARTLDDMVQINTTCYAGKGTSKVYGEVYPATMEVYDMQQEEIDCTIPQNKLSPGSHAVTFESKFNFETIGYVKRYFTSRDRLNSALKDGVDLLDQYQVEDKDPVARYSNGPIRLGIGPDSALTGIDSTYQVKPRLGITLDADTNWDGMIEEIKEIVVIIPDSMELDLDTCSDTNFKEYTEDRCVSSNVEYETAFYRACEDEGAVTDDTMRACLLLKCQEELDGYNAYYLDTSRNTNHYKDIEDFVSYNCRLDIVDEHKLLGNTPISTKYFFVKARYDYKIVEDTSVKVIESDTAAGYAETSYSKSEESYTGKPDELVSDIYTIYYASSPNSISEWSDRYGMDPQLVIAMIAAGSKNDPTTVGLSSPLGETNGLMQITEEDAAVIAAELGIVDYDLFDPDTNIRFGVRRMYDLLNNENIPFDSEDPELNREYLLATYYGGVCGIRDGEYVGVFCDSQDCIGDKRYWCEYDDDYEQVRLYVQLVETYYKKVQELNLVQSGELKSETNEDNFLVQGSFTINGETKDFSETIDLDTSGTKLIISIDDSKKLKIFIYTNNQTETVYEGTIPTSEEYSERWIYIDNNPAFSYYVVVEDGKLMSFNYEILAYSVINSDYLIEGADEVEVWTGFIWTKYEDDEIFLYYKDYMGNFKEFCTIEWEDDDVMGQCDEKDSQGFYVRKRDTVEGTVLPDYTKVQFEYVPLGQFASMAS